MTHSDSRRGKIQTVCGIIDPAMLGQTLMHEHILCDIRSPDKKSCCQGPEISLETHWAINYGEIIAPNNALLDMAEIAVDELEDFKRDGGAAIVELSCGGLSPDPVGLRAVAERTGVHIIMGCGHYAEEYQDSANAIRTADSFATEIISQINEGAWGTNIRAGIIGEIGCQAPWTAQERTVMEGAVVAMQETGAALNVHPGRDPDQPQEIADYFISCGVDMGRTILSHIDRTIFDRDRMFRLADTGCVIEFDLFGMENSFYYLNTQIDMPNDAERIRWIRELMDRGHASQIAISHDICYRTRLRRFGGHGYGHIFRNIIPMMRRRGFTQEEIDLLLIETPKRLLAFV